MINFDKGMLAYTTRDVRNYGMFKTNSLYKYLFTREDNMLLDTGAIKLLPYSMYKFYVSHNTVLAGKTYNIGDEIEPKDFENCLKTLIKTNVIRCELKDCFKNKDEKEIVDFAKIYDCVGQTFNQASISLGLDYDVLKKEFDLKQGGKQKRITEQDIEKLKGIVLGV